MWFGAMLAKPFLWVVVVVLAAPSGEYDATAIREVTTHLRYLGL